MLEWSRGRRCRCVGRRIRQRLVFEMVLQDRFDAGQRVGAVVQGTSRGRFQARDRVLVAEPDQAQTAAVAHLRMRLGGQDLTEQFGGMRTRGIGPVRAAAKASTPGTAGEPWAGVRVKRSGSVDGQSCGRGWPHAGLHGRSSTVVAVRRMSTGFADQLVRHAVEVAVGRDMIIEIDLQSCATRRSHSVRQARRTQRRLVEGGEQAGAGAFAFAEGLVVEAR